ncbi:MAG: enoyl-CoA hydratase-related protein [Smithella sp.]|nr:enoyl-CoA hydratase-related protein [Smithella sp.]
MNAQAILLTELKSGIGTITFNRPERKNSFSPELLFMLHNILQEWRLSDEVRVVVITGGSGKAFSSGYDIASIPTDIPTNMSTEEIKFIKANNPMEMAMKSVEEFPYPTIAMMNGYAFGAGLNLAMCCDMRIAQSDISVGMPPAKLGLVYHPEGLRQFIDVVGMAKTREIFFTARTYNDTEALQMGLVDRLVQPEDLQKITYEIAEEIAANSPLTLKGTKRILAMFRERMSLTEKQTDEADMLIGEAFNSEDIKEGMIAFFERRKPIFKGK